MPRRAVQPPEIGLSTDPFADLLQVLAGSRIVRPDSRAAKTLYLLARADSDSVITKTRFASCYRSGKGRTRTDYTLDAAPSVFTTLMDVADVEAVDEPLLVRVPAGQVPSIAGFPAWDHGALLVWMLVEQAQVVLKVRTVDAQWQRPWSAPAPKAGPDEPPDLESWRGHIQAFDTANCCPHCGTADAAYRDYENYCVCERCGRSFDKTGSKQG